MLCRTIGPRCGVRQGVQWSVTSKVAPVNEWVSLLVASGTDVRASHDPLFELAVHRQRLVRYL